MLTRMEQGSRVETPTIDDLARFDRKRSGEKLSNEDRTGAPDLGAKIPGMKDGTTHLAESTQTLDARRQVVAKALALRKSR